MELPAWVAGLAAVVLVILLVAVLLRLIQRSRSGHITLEWEIDRDHRHDDDQP